MQKDTECFIVAYEKPDETQLAIDSFRATGGDCHLTILDNSKNKLNLTGMDSHHHFPWNPSLTRVWNWAIGISVSDWTIISNSDVEFKLGWLERWETTEYKKAALLHNWFYCFFIHKDLIRQVGWFDERYTDGYWEDVDYVRRVKLHGYNWNDNAFQDVILHKHKAENPHYTRNHNMDWYQRKWGDLKGWYDFERNGPVPTEFNWYPSLGLVNEQT